MELREAFAVLEIEDGSTIEEVKTAYRRMCIVWHPDRFKDPELKAQAEEKLKRINEAFATIKSSTGASESAVDTDPGVVYQDLVCRYRGGDKRLWDVSKLEIKGRQCAVQITPDGLLLVTFRDGQVDEFATYSSDTFVRLRTSEKEWILTTDKSRLSSSWYLPSENIEIVVTDPEGILSHAMTVELTFRSGYYAQLFTKRIREAWGLITPDPKPKPKPVVDSKDDIPDWVPIAAMIFIAVIILFMYAMIQSN